jgi:hypothetical protein
MRHLRYEAVRVLPRKSPVWNPFYGSRYVYMDEEGNPLPEGKTLPATYTVIQVLAEENVPAVVEHREICSGLDRKTAARVCAALEISHEREGDSAEVVEHMIARMRRITK